MPAAVTDKFMKGGVAGTLTTLQSPGKALAASSITIGSGTNWPTDTAVTFAIRVVDASGELVAGTYTEWVGTVSGTTISGLTGTPAYGTDQVYAAGSTTQVYIPVSAYAYNRAMDGLLVEHDQDGTHGVVTATSVATSGTMSSGGVASFSSHLDVNDASSAVRDSSDNELLKFAKTASAVNELEITNNSTGNAPKLAATGGDTNIGLNLASKGTGEVQLNGVGISGGWTSFTPTWTNLTVTSSTVTGAYKQIGKVVFFRVQVVLGGGNAPSGAVSFTLPVAANAAYTATNNETQFATGSALDFGTGAFQLIGRFTNTDGATKCNVVVANAGASYVSHTALSSLVPMTWANNDILSMNGTYEAA